MNIINAERTHIPDLIQLMVQFYSESGYDVDIEKAKKVFEMYISRKELGSIFIAVDNEVVIGYLIVKYYLAMSTYGYVCSLEDLFVIENQRKRKVGSALVEAAIENAHSNEIKSFNVEVGQSNIGAIKLYKNFGFKIRQKGIEIMEMEEI